jgi:hypothetical protein
MRLRCAVSCAIVREPVADDLSTTSPSSPHTSGG